jgi:hypothetical protein
MPRKSAQRAFFGAWAFIALLGLVDWVWASAAGLSFVGWGRAGLGFGFLASIALFYRFTGRSSQLYEASHYTALWTAFTISAAIFTYLTASLKLPLHEVEFARLDAALGFDWYRWVESIKFHPALELLLLCAYNSFLPQIIGSIMYFAFTRRSDHNNELLGGAMVSLLATAVLAGLLPAIGPHFPGATPLCQRALIAVREGQSKFALAEMQGIITMPSYHTVLAILLIYVHRPPSRWFLPLAVLNALMLLSIPSEGPHYLVDMLAGGAVAAVSIPLTARALAPVAPHALAAGVRRRAIRRELAID